MVLDFGLSYVQGSGVCASWAISMAERFPRSEVIGVGGYDLPPSQGCDLMPTTLLPFLIADLVPSELE